MVHSGSSVLWAIGDPTRRPPSVEGGAARGLGRLGGPGPGEATARELRDVLAASGRFFDRGVPIKMVPAPDGGAPAATELTPNKVVMAAHDFCRPVRQQGDELVRVTLPQRVVRVHVVLADISHMAEMDRVFREFFPVDPPACMAWSMQLRFGNGCEIECVALAS
jgi:hypothetical protein